MAQATHFSAAGIKHDQSVELPTGVFAVDIASHDLIGQAYRTYLANGRSAGASVLNRGDVRGGGKKPHRQKGTGRARVGSSRVPNWRGGGSVFGPTGLENYTLGMPVKMKRLAIRQALTVKADAGAVLIIESFMPEQGLVKPTAQLLAKLNVTGNVVMIVPEKTLLIDRATRNISGLQVVSATYLNTFTVMNADHLIFVQDALSTVEAWLSPAKKAEVAS